MTPSEGTILPRYLLGGWPWLVATGLPVLIVALSGLFVVRGYTLDGSTLRIRRLLWDTAVSLESLQRAGPHPRRCAARCVSSATAASSRSLGSSATGNLATTEPSRWIRSLAVVL